MAKKGFCVAISTGWFAGRGELLAETCAMMTEKWLVWPGGAVHVVEARGMLSEVWWESRSR